MLEFRVLGSLEVLACGEPRSLGRRQERALLALLVLADGGVVGLDRAVDALRGQEPPARPADVLRVYASRLRRAVADGGPARLTAERGGYRLRSAAVRRRQRAAGRGVPAAARGPRPRRPPVGH